MFVYKVVEVAVVDVHLVVLLSPFVPMAALGGLGRALSLAKASPHSALGQKGLRRGASFPGAGLQAGASGAVVLSWMTRHIAAG